jgi:hypothetical protein
MPARRRAYGEGTISKRKDGRWIAIAELRLRGCAGRRARVSQRAGAPPARAARLTPHGAGLATDALTSDSPPALGLLAAY